MFIWYTLGGTGVGEMHQMLIKDDLIPDLNEAKEVHAQLDALHELLLNKGNKNLKSEFGDI